MNYQKGSAAVWVMLILVIVIVAGAAYWYWMKNPMQPPTSATTKVLTQQSTTAGTPTTPTSNPTTQPAPTQNSPAPSATIGQSSLVSTNPIITGTAEGLSSVEIEVSEITTATGGGPYPDWGGIVNVENGTWSFTPSQSNEWVGGQGGLSVGSYKVLVWTPENDGQHPLVSATLKVQLPNATSNSSASATPRLSASPTVGPAPLTVAFSGTGTTIQWEVDYGDGSNFVGCTSESSCPVVSFNQEHTYSSPGIYTATLGADGGESFGHVNIVVTGNFTKPVAAIDLSSWNSLKRASSTSGMDTATFTGEALNVPYVRLYLEDTYGTVEYDSGVVPVTNNDWSVTVSAPGSDYGVSVYGYSNAAGTSEGAFGELANAPFFNF
jgi:hypothetical protein